MHYFTYSATECTYLCSKCSISHIPIHAPYPCQPTRATLPVPPTRAPYQWSHYQSPHYPFTPTHTVVMSRARK